MQSSTPSQFEPWTAETASAFAAEMIEFARGKRAEVRVEVPPISVLLLSDGTAQPATAIGRDAAERAEMVRRLSRQLGAIYAIDIQEAWVKDVTLKDLGEVQALRAAGVRVSEMEGRREVILCTVDGPGLQRMWTAEIFPDGTTGPVVEYPREGRITGQITNLSGRLGEN